MKELRTYLFKFFTGDELVVVALLYDLLLWASGVRHLLFKELVLL